MEITRGAVLALLLMTVAGCEKTLWHAPSICRDHLDLYEKEFDPSNPERDHTIVLAGIKAVGGKEAAVRLCSEAISEAVTACSEYKFKSDQGLDCTQRRIVPPLETFVIRLFDTGERALASAAQK